MWKRTCTSRTCSTSFIQRDVSHAHGQVGSNQKSAMVGPDGVVIGQSHTRANESACLGST